MPNEEMTPGIRGLVYEEPEIFRLGSPGRRGYALPQLDVPERRMEEMLPPELVRDAIDGFPEVSEVEVVRHFTRMSQWNYGVDLGLYPLGSCTMKYNPKINEDVVRLPGFAMVHPYQPAEQVQGLLRLMLDLEKALCEITGMDRATLQPAAGAQGEFTGIKMIRAHLQTHGNPRSTILLPDSAHGTNAATTTICGYKVIKIPTGPNGYLETEQIARQMDEEVAALMITNPNTLGLFERNIKEIADVVHTKGARVYCDGANLNALLGITLPGDQGVDVLHLNLHKTFSTPHGGGGPGSGPVLVKEELAPYLPVPAVEEKDGKCYLSHDRPRSIGKVRSFYGNVGMLIRAYAYIRSLGSEGLRRISETAIINANYIQESLKAYYHLPYHGPCMHECVFSDKLQAKQGVTALDIAKRLMDYGFHPPTIYFPLIVKGALMIEPTESESRQSLDQFITAMIAIAEEAEKDPDLVRRAPHKTKRSRLNEVRAVKQPDLRYAPPSQAE